MNKLQINDKKTWVYVFVRMDLPIEQQMVQACHAALEVGLSFERSSEVSSLIVLQVPNEEQIETALKEIKSQGLLCDEFIEPDWDYRLTAFAVEPVTQEQRKIFRKWKLWKGPTNAG